MNRAALLVCGLTLFATNTLAATRTWTGAASKLWSNAGNWVEGGAPVAGDTLVFPAAAPNLTSQNDLADETKFASISFDDDYVLTGNAFGIRDGLTVTAQADVNVSNRINVTRGQTWTTRAPLTRLATAWMVFDGKAGDTHTLTLHSTGELRVRPAATGRVVHSGGGLREVDAWIVGYWETTSSQRHTVNDGRLLFRENFYRGVGHNLTLNGAPCDEPPCDDALTLASGPLYPNNLGRLIATGGLVEASRATDPSARSVAGEITFGSDVVYQVAVTPFTGPAPDAPLAVGYPGPGTYYQDGSRTVTLNGAKLSVVAVAPFPGCMQRTIIGNDGTDAIIGTFDGLPEGSTFTTASGQQFRIAYAGGTGNDVTITAVDAGADVCGVPAADR
ncbi:MAG TPA: hypothetical protein VNI54_08945 [Thermoanaerobaculia bacterium]|nr:hypothetical protein [Thermoanaerobaculia bacterium]